MEVNPNVLHRWRKEFRQGPGNAFRGQGQRRWSEGRIAELERKIGQQTLEIDFLKGLCLAKILSSSEINSLHMFSSAAVSAMTGAHVPLRGIRVGPAHPLLAIAWIAPVSLPRADLPTSLLNLGWTMLSH
jgi:hypothetical protein